MPRSAGSKNKTTQERVNAVEGMMLRHYSDTQVIRACQKQWGVKEKTARRYIREVRQRWIDEAEASRPAAKAAAKARLHDIGRQAEGQPQILIQLERLLADIEGTRDPVKVDQAVTLDIDGHAQTALGKLERALALDDEGGE